MDDDIVIHLPGVLRRDEYNLSIPLTVIDDAVTEANETFLIQLHDGQYFVDDNYSSVTVTVVDDDCKLMDFQTLFQEAHMLNMLSHVDVSL